MRRGCRPRTPAIAQAPLGLGSKEGGCAARLSQAGAGGDPPPPPVLLLPRFPLPPLPRPQFPLRKRCEPRLSKSEPARARGVVGASPTRESHVFREANTLRRRGVCRLRLRLLLLPGGEEWGRGKEVGDRGGGGKRRRRGCPPPPRVAPPCGAAAPSPLQAERRLSDLYWGVRG